MPAIAMPACVERLGPLGVVEALLDEVAAELDRAEAEAPADRDHLVPVGGLAREDADARPRRRPVEPRHDRAREGEVAADELRRTGRRLEHDPALVADLVERARRLVEVDAPEPGRAVADLHADVLQMDASDEVAEAAQLGRRVHRARHHVRGVEVAAERRRVDGGREAADRLGCQRALVEQRDAALGGAAAERAERGGGALDVGFVAQLGAAEERDEQRVAPELGRPVERALHVLCRRGRDGGLAVGDAAEIAVLAEHQAGDGEARVGLGAAKRLEPVALGAPEDHLDAGEPEPLRAPEELAVVRARQHVGHHAGEAGHRITGAPSRSAERQAARVSSSERRLCLAELYGSRSSAIADISSAIVPASPSGYQAPSSGNGTTSPSRSSSRKSEPSRTLPRIVPSVPWIQNGAPPRDVRASPTVRISDVRAARPADLHVRAPGIARVVRLAGHAVVGGPHLDGAVAVEPAAADVDPVHVVVVDHEVVELVEVQTHDRRHVLVVEVGHGDDVADRATGDEQRGRAQRRTPAPVLVHGQLQARFVGRLDHAARRLEVERERLLGEDVLARGERLQDERGPLGRARRDVDDGHVGIGEQRLDAVVDLPHERKAFAHSGRRRLHRVVHAGDVHVPRLVGREVEILRRGAAADDGDGERLRGEGGAVGERLRPRRPGGHRARLIERDPRPRAARRARRQARPHARSPGPSSGSARGRAPARRRCREPERGRESSRPSAGPRRRAR